jgi:diaminopimelate epimerase
MGEKMLLEFWKATGAGNDFVMVESLDGQIPEVERPRMARVFCPRGLSVGADGLIVIDPSEKHHFFMRYYNRDGSEAETCGNGARCAARFAYVRGIAPAEMQFETHAGVYHATVTPETVLLDMPDIHAPTLDIKVDAKEFSGTVHRVDVGVPHVVVFVNDVEEVDAERVGRAVRHAEQFKPAGVNVNFVQVVDGRTLVVRTYERGVEAETLACGTGSISCAVVAGLKGFVKAPVRIHTRGGPTLTVHYRLRDGGSIGGLKLEGEARIVFRGEIEYEFAAGSR